MGERISLIEKVRIMKGFMSKDDWYTSEKIRMLDPMKKIKFCISSTLSLLYDKGYLERKPSRRIYFESARRLYPKRRYHGIWAYKFKPEFLSVNYEQLNIDYEYSKGEESGDSGTTKKENH